MRVPGDETESSTGREPPADSLEGGEDPSTGGTNVPLSFLDRDPDALDDTTELYLMERHAVDDGCVTVQLSGWERDEDTVHVEYALPTGTRETDRYRWPTAGRYGDSDFLALVRGLGYAPSTADLVGGEFARARKENGDWRIVTGRTPRRGTHERTRRSTRTETTEDEVFALTKPPVSRIVTGVRSRLEDIDPMDAGLISVLFAVLAVLVPATGAILVGGLTGPVAALGGVLLAGAVVTLWTSIVATSV